ncbi:L-type lectin-domain containing receptor kinase IX.1-like [Cryptomeria japonica]|uniref:L-type lectin-domain containing receptor kinase IX.1-like n=1 Tax=Cryptomeria japonica TaxID=3369 RepID=UPI0027DAAD8F|nr:L-type lectin-domain containing receptor kinase IX.1-like [Cryptomeria japonica]
MAKLCYSPSSIFLFSCVAASLIFMSHAGNLSFSFPPSTDFIIQNDAYFLGDKAIELTKNQATGNLGSSLGWAAYNHSVPLWDKSSRALASFSNHFQFIIGRGNDNRKLFGDGLAFFLAPFNLEQPLNATGGGLGLFNDSTLTGLSYQMVAVEFDTFKNYFDPDGNHVGIDINSILSKVNVSLTDVAENSSLCDKKLKNGKQWDAWVKRLQVFLLCNPDGISISKPPTPILIYDIDLRDFLPETIRVGLSASTGNSSETHTVNSWNFSCQYSWELSAVPPPTNAHNESNSHFWVILIVVFCSAMAICGLVFIGWRRYFRKSEGVGEASEESDVELDQWFSQGPRKFSYAELSTATGNFSDNEKLGQGGFGGVYRGVLPGTKEVVAVKKISQGSSQGRKEYVSEVTIISRLRHRNLVRLLGWCHRKGELLLVYEYLPNGSLDNYIFGEQKGSLNWERRYNIACDLASALVYLHEEWDQLVVHRDVKASNVMLDSNFNAKLGDFGLARLVERHNAASHTTVVAGTFGYLAPECVMTGKASPETDVFSFGAVTLEIACGRRPVDRSLNKHNCRLVEWVWDLYEHGKILCAADEKLGGLFNENEMERMLLVGLLCSHPDPTSRPKMREVTKILKGETELPYVPLGLPVAVYSQRLRPDVMLSPSAFTSSTASSGPDKISEYPLFVTEPR